MIRRLRSLALLLAAFLVVAVAPSWAVEVDLEGCKADLYFSPKGGGEAALMMEIGGAEREILVLAYSFTSQPIIDALKAARARGVDVRVVLDKGQDSPRYAALRQGLPVRIDPVHAIQHNKVMIFDRKAVAFGSYNITEGAEKRNAENLRIEYCPQTAEVFLRNWELHQAHSVAPKQGKAKQRVKATIGGAR